MFGGFALAVTGHSRRNLATSANIISGNFMIKCPIMLFKFFIEIVNQNYFLRPKYLGATGKADQIKEYCAHFFTKISQGC